MVVLGFVGETVAALSCSKRFPGCEGTLDAMIFVLNYFAAGPLGFADFAYHPLSPSLNCTISTGFMANFSCAALSRASSPRIILMIASWSSFTRRVRTAVLMSLAQFQHVTILSFHGIAKKSFLSFDSKPQNTHLTLISLYRLCTS